MHSDDSPVPPQDATIIGSELDRYLRAELDEFPPAAADASPGQPETQPASVPKEPDAPGSDPERASLAIARNPSLAAKAFAFSGASMFLADRRFGIVLMSNAAFLGMTGNRYEEVVGVAPDLLVSSRCEESLRKLRHALAQTGSWDGEAWIRRRDGSEFPARLAVRTVCDGLERRKLGFVTTVTDLSDVKHAEHQLRHLADHDALTGLVNRVVLQDRLEQALASCRRSGSRLALLFLDLDRFKYINDSLGHATGDELLRRAANRLKASVREEDTVARMGGDEFVVLLKDVPHANAAAQVALKLGREVHRPYHIGNHELTVTTSIGISVFPDNGSDGATLIQHADTAMYRGKEGGRNRYVFFQDEMSAQMHEHFSMGHNLALAVQRNEFVLHYQPQIDLATGKITGAEALIRWRHPELGLLGPDRFIPIAEETGLIRQVGEWVIRSVGMEMHAWRAAGLPPFRMAVNLSALQIARPQHTEALSAAVVAAGMTGADAEFEVEITESSLMTGEHTLAAATALKGLGLTLAIDDFGTGYSSMLALRQLPLDRIKIDRSFIKRLPADTNDAAMTAAVIAMGKALGLRILAEGVETPEQLEFLRAHGCDEAQGFLFSRPLPIEAFRSLLAKGEVNALPPQRHTG